MDDNTYDYTAVKGYSAEEHTVEKTISVTVLMPEPNTALSSKAQIPSPQVNSISTLGDVDINPTDFPDEKFREYLLNAYSKGGNKIAVADVTIIDIRDRTDITDLKGIEKFTDLTILCCFNTGIQSLDVSKNTALTKLYCYDTEIQALDVSKIPNWIPCIATTQKSKPWMLERIASCCGWIVTTQKFMLWMSAKIPL